MRDDQGAALPEVGLSKEGARQGQVGRIGLSHPVCADFEHPADITLRKIGRLSRVLPVAAPRVRLSHQLPVFATGALKATELSRGMLVLCAQMRGVRQITADTHAVPGLSIEARLQGRSFSREAMIAVADKRSLHLLEFAERRALPGELKRLLKAARGQLGIGRFEPVDQIEAELGAYFRGEQADFETPLTLHGTPFWRAVWDELRRIPPGETRSYSQVAEAIGKPTAVRAVARANGANQISIVIPCHRVIGSDGSLTGYGGGLWRKQKLIDLERVLASQA